MFMYIFIFLVVKLNLLILEKKVVFFNWVGLDFFFLRKRVEINLNLK